MDYLQEQTLSCPYCGESIDVLIDPQDAGDQYIEDCQVCCRPITINVTTDSMGNLSVSAYDENDVY
ncbi:MAG: CPXCG motif-containing cysteine-rich protein [Pseudohongiella sp.]|nr:CPXCG motif-containing cysteine-rich protein [Pseudohongiella sp.]